MLRRSNPNKKTSFQFQIMISMLLSRITKYNLYPNKFLILSRLKKSILWSVTCFIIVIAIFHCVTWLKIHLHLHCWVWLLCLLFIRNNQLLFHYFYNFFETFQRQTKKRIWIDWVVNDHIIQTNTSSRPINEVKLWIDCTTESWLNAAKSKIFWNFIEIFSKLRISFEVFNQPFTVHLAQSIQISFGQMWANAWRMFLIDSKWVLMKFVGFPFHCYKM